MNVISGGRFGNSGGNFRSALKYPPSYKELVGPRNMTSHSPRFFSSRKPTETFSGGCFVNSLNCCINVCFAKVVNSVIPTNLHSKRRNTLQLNHTISKRVVRRLRIRKYLCLTANSTTKEDSRLSEEHEKHLCVSKLVLNSWLGLVLSEIQLLNCFYRKARRGSLPFNSGQSASCSVEILF